MAISCLDLYELSVENDFRITRRNVVNKLEYFNEFCNFTRAGPAHKNYSGHKMTTFIFNDEIIVGERFFTLFTQV